jgi:hypothetical protein
LYFTRQHVNNTWIFFYVKKIDLTRSTAWGNDLVLSTIPQPRSCNSQILEALNKGEIPSTGSLVEVFNKGILERCLKLYSDMMAKLPLPLYEKSLQNVHENSKGEAMKSFDEQHFGRHHAKRSVMQLDEEIEKVLIVLSATLIVFSP